VAGGSRGSAGGRTPIFSPERATPQAIRGYTGGLDGALVDRFAGCRGHRRPWASSTRSGTA